MAKTIGPEASDGERRAVERQRGNDRVDARSIQQTCVHHRVRFVDASANRGDDALDDPKQVAVVFERDVTDLGDAAIPLDINPIEAVDENVRDVAIAEQRFQWTQTEQLVEHVDNEAIPLRMAEGHAAVL